MPSNTAGRRYAPSASAGPVGRTPPVTSLAPSASPLSTYPSTHSRCRNETSGPTSVAGSEGSPTTTRSVAAANSSTTRSWTERSTRIRLRAQQSCPQLSNTAYGDDDANFSMSASANTTLGLLPPSSRLTFFTVPAAARMISCPVAVSPVNATLPIPGWAAIAAPTTGPGPVTTLSTPGGSPASSASSPSRIAVSGEYEAGFRTAVLPAASAGPTFHEAIMIGKFQGTMSPTTPIGSRSVKSSPGRVTGIVAPWIFVAAPA